jgi:hypothetical protein
MKRLPAICLVSCLVLLLSCAAPAKKPTYRALFNLASDVRYYKYVEYKSSQRFEDTLLLSLIDKRPEQERVYNEDIQWFYDDIWAMSPAEMLEKIISRELKSTHMFKSVDVNEKAPSLILEIELISLIGHYGQGRVARGALKVHSVLRSASENRVITEKDYEEVSSCLVPRFGNAYRYMYLHIAQALHAVVRDMMMGLENALLRESGK